MCANDNANDVFDWINTKFIIEGEIIMKIDKTEVFGFDSAFRGMRNPKNSWHLSDSSRCFDYYECEGCKYLLFDYDGCLEINKDRFILGGKDLKLARTLIKGGTEHSKYMRMIQVWADFDMPRYWWSEFDTYKIGTTANSCSTMHKLFNKDDGLSFDMFEYDIEDFEDMERIIDKLNVLRDEYLYPQKPLNQKERDKILRRAKQLLPEGFLQKRTVNTNYATLRGLLLQRNNHRLVPEWQDTVCKWITTLPYSKELIFCGLEDEYERLK